MLPGLLLRALIPLGFMPMFGPDFSVRLTLCEGYAPVPVSMDMSMDMSMKMPAPSHQEHGTCPYGASPTLAALPVLAALSATIQVSARALIPTSQIISSDVSPRAQSQRGPPRQA